MNTFIGIQKLWYGDELSEAPTYDSMAALVEGMTEVTNVHQDTWGYEETDPETTEYVNELTGQNYYVDMTKQGIPTISFTLGEYEYQQKADLQGGTVITTGSGSSETAVGWQKPTEMNVIYKAVVALSKTGVYIIFPKAQITGKGDIQEKNIGLGVQAMCCETGDANIAPEYWLKKKQIVNRYSVLYGLTGCTSEMQTTPLSTPITVPTSSSGTLTYTASGEPITEQAAYHNTLAVGSNYAFVTTQGKTLLQVIVKMGASEGHGPDITSQCFNANTGEIDIAHVTGYISVIARAGNYSQVTSPTGDPSASDYYELTDSGYKLSSDTSVDSEKTYYSFTEAT